MNETSSKHQPWTLGQDCRACTPEDRKGCPYCVGTGTMRYVGWADEPWSEVIPGLWIGGHEYQAQEPTFEPDWGVVGPTYIVTADELAEARFDVVASLYEDDCHPGEDVEHLSMVIDDNLFRMPTVDQIESLWEMAEQVACHVRAERKVLVRCHAGLNRSSLVAALAMIQMGHEPQEAIDLIREKRSPRFALFNNRFVEIILAQTVRST